MAVGYPVSQLNEIGQIIKSSRVDKLGFLALADDRGQVAYASTGQDLRRFNRLSIPSMLGLVSRLFKLSELVITAQFIHSSHGITRSLLLRISDEINARNCAERDRINAANCVGSGFSHGSHGFAGASIEKVFT